MYYKVFLDTNIYDGANYSFHNAMFSLLRKMTEDGALQLKINSVVEGEVKKHIGRDVKVAAKKLLEAVKDRSLSSFRNIPSFQDYLMIPNPKDWVQKAEEEFEEFLISCNCDRISINGIDVEKIMENYFNQKWPFEAAKTDEFKDAFIVASIIKDIIGTEDVLGITEDQTYCVISNDKGFRAALEQGTVGIEDVRIFPGLKEFTDYLAEKDNYAQHIKAFIESGNADDEIQEAVKEAINSADISVESLFWDIEELDILDIDEIEYTPYIISVYDEGIAKVSFAVTCKVTVYYKYTDENESYYDKEDQCYLWQKIVELEEEYTYTPVLCSDNSSGLTSNILVTDKIIYFNNSGCGISGFNYKKKGKQVNVSTFNSNKYSSITHSDTVKKLFYQADNSLYAVNEANGEITKVLDNVNGSINLSITDNVLLYASTSDNKNYTYYGYNIVNGNNGEIVSNVKKLVISNKKYYYYTDNYVYVNDNGKVKGIYKSRYNVLSDMELINNNTLQVVDTSTALDKKEKIVNIDLSDKNYKSSVVDQKYSLIRIIQ